MAPTIPLLIALVASILAYREVRKMTRALAANGGHYTSGPLRPATAAPAVTTVEPAPAAPRSVPQEGERT